MNSFYRSWMNPALNIHETLHYNYCRCNPWAWLLHFQSYSPAAVLGCSELSPAFRAFTLEAKHSTFMLSLEQRPRYPALCSCRLNINTNITWITGQVRVGLAINDSVSRVKKEKRRILYGDRLKFGTLNVICCCIVQNFMCYLKNIFSFISYSSNKTAVWHLDGKTDSVASFLTHE